MPHGTAGACGLQTQQSINDREIGLKRERPGGIMRRERDGTEHITLDPHLQHGIADSPDYDPIVEVDAVGPYVAGIIAKHPVRSVFTAMPGTPLQNEAQHHGKPRRSQCTCSNVWPDTHQRNIFFEISFGMASL